MNLWWYILGFVILRCTLMISADSTNIRYPIEYMSKDEREALKEEARDMFYHAYNAYMNNAYPADELMPLSCKGRYRGTEVNRGDIDFTLGNFSLTLVDTLDTLVVLGNFEEFENAVKLVIKDVTFDTDVIVSLFETNIRMLGGLLSGHILAEYLQQRADLMPWYQGELLDLAKDLGYRFLPAFNTTTGIPYGKINLKHGMKGVSLELYRETCTACAGSMILELAALSRLTGEPIFEEKAQKAMDVLWKMRHRGTDLMGSILNVHSGDWVRRDSGVGAGIDSYYEYCLKAYILLGDEKYLGRFNKHYHAVMKYVSQGPMLLDVHMHRPNTNSKNFMDALLAFWPGLQVLKGDIKPAVETHEMLYQVMQRHNFIPEAFTTDFQIHWARHPLRPEFLESTYFLYRATGDHYYLNVGRKVLRSLQTYTRVPCGYAAVSDVRTNKHDDTMDSFFLSETLKYLFLLFAETDDLMLNLDEFIFTTEGHLLPLTLASTRVNVSMTSDRDLIHVDEMDRTCPNSLHLFPASVRQPLRNMVENVCPSRSLTRRLSASQFQPNNADHLKMLGEMGITILTSSNGRVQLLHTFSNAKSARHAEEGIIFMQEMVEISKMRNMQQSNMIPKQVSFYSPPNFSKQINLLAGPAHFGLILQEDNKITGLLVQTNPFTACTKLKNPEAITGKIALILRGDCIFVEKARRVQEAGAIAAIVVDNVLGTSAESSRMFAMSKDSKDEDDIKIPVVFLFNVEANELFTAYRESHENLVVTIGDYIPKDTTQLQTPEEISMLERLKGSIKDFLNRQIISEYHQTKDATEENTQTTFRNEYFKATLMDQEFNIVARYIQVPDNILPQRPLNWPEDLTFPLRKDLTFCWQVLKQIFISEIFANANTDKGTTIQKSELMNLYHRRNVIRKLDTTEDIHLKGSIFWFLEELSEMISTVTVGYPATYPTMSNPVEFKIIKKRLMWHLTGLSVDDNNEPFNDVDYAIIAFAVLCNKPSLFLNHQVFPVFEMYFLNQIEKFTQEYYSNVKNGKKSVTDKEYINRNSKSCTQEEEEEEDEIISIAKEKDAGQNFECKSNLMNDFNFLSNIKVEVNQLMKGVLCHLFPMNEDLNCDKKHKEKDKEDTFLNESDTSNLDTLNSINENSKNIIDNNMSKNQEETMENITNNNKDAVSAKEQLNPKTFNTPNNMNDFEYMKEFLMEHLEKSIQAKPLSEMIFYSNNDLTVTSTENEIMISSSYTIEKLVLAVKHTEGETETIPYKTDFKTCYKMLMRIFVNEIYSNLSINEKGIVIKHSDLVKIFAIKFTVGGNLLLMNVLRQINMKINTLELMANWLVYEIAEFNYTRLKWYKLGKRFKLVKITKETIISHLENLAKSQYQQNSNNMIQKFGDIDYVIISYLIVQNNIDNFHKIFSRYEINMYTKLAKQSKYNIATITTEFREQLFDNFESFLLEQVERAIKDIFEIAEIETKEDSEEQQLYEYIKEQVFNLLQENKSTVCKRFPFNINFQCN